MKLKKLATIEATASMGLVLFAQENQSVAVTCSALPYISSRPYVANQEQRTHVQEHSAFLR